MIYATDQQIKRMGELIRHYPEGKATGDDLYGFLIELNETQRELTYDEENLVIEKEVWDINQY